jgi:hypothetical protein
VKEWGSLRSFLERRAARGLSTPAIDNRPELYEDLIPVWEAFEDLSKTRARDLGSPMPITFAEISAWLDLHSIEGADTRAEFAALIRSMDEDWFRIEAKKAQERKPPDAHADRSNRRKPREVGRG